MNPLTRLAAVAVAIVVPTAVGHWALSLAVLLTVAAATVAEGMAQRVWPECGLVLLPLAASLFLTHGLFFVEGRTVLWSLGPARLTVEGLSFAGAMVLRAAVFVAVLLAFSCGTRPADIMAVFARYRLPAELGFVLCSTLTIAPDIRRRAQAIREAQQLRGLRGGRSLPARLRSVRVLAVPLLLSLMHDAEQRATALEARGFGAGNLRTSLREVPDSKLQSAFRWMVLAGLAVFLVIWFGPAGGGNAPSA
ncbi:energy-coupling factor transporter transmembrane component T family protein [Pseudarthrobacter sp. N5]|uniref:energy-coupling factor transporter transmembrane component T family protein n=1 Tax=Pseudarthrobacter sp. N5 TaxID=3418416 RepID=UPI003CF2B5BD